MLKCQLLQAQDAKEKTTPVCAVIPKLERTSELGGLVRTQIAGFPPPKVIQEVKMGP